MTRFHPLKLDPDFAAFYGLPVEIPFLFPADHDPDAAPGWHLRDIARSLTEAAPAIQGPAAVPLRRFLAAWPSIEQLERYLAIGNHTFALQVARELTLHEPDLPCAQFSLGIAAARTGHLDEAREALDQALKLCPERGDALIEMSLALSLSGRWDGARLMLDRLQATHPVFADLFLYRPLIEHRDAAAITRLRALLEGVATAERENRSEDARTAVEALVEAFPESAEAARRSAISLRHTGDPVRAMTLALRAARLDERSPLIQDTLARFYIETGDFIEAERAALRSRSLAPDWVPAVMTLAQVLRQDGRPGTAALHLREVTSRHPENVALIRLHGQCLLDAGRVDEARSCFQELLDREPESPVALFNLGYLEDTAGNSDQAAAHYRRAFEAAPRLLRAREACALALARGGNMEESRGLLEELVREHPDSPCGYRGLGDLLATRDAAGAVEYYRKAMEILPDMKSSGLAYLSGNRMLLERKFEEAGRFFELSIRIDRRRHESWCNLGVARKEEGQPEAAIAAMLEAVRLAPEVSGYHRNLSVFYREAFRRNPIGNIRCLFRSLRESRAARMAAADDSSA